MGKGKWHVPPTAPGKLDVGFGGTFLVSAEVPGSAVIHADEHEIQLLELLCCETGVRRDSSPYGLHWEKKGLYKSPGEPVTADADPGLLQKATLPCVRFFRVNDNVPSSGAAFILLSTLSTCLTFSEKIPWFKLKLLLTLMLFSFPVY